MTPGSPAPGSALVALEPAPGSLEGPFAPWHGESRGPSLGGSVVFAGTPKIVLFLLVSWKATNQKFTLKEGTPKSNMALAYPIATAALGRHIPPTPRLKSVSQLLHSIPSRDPLSCAMFAGEGTLNPILQVVLPGSQKDAAKLRPGPVVWPPFRAPKASQQKSPIILSAAHLSMRQIALVIFRVGHPCDYDSLGIIANGQPKI